MKWDDIFYEIPCKLVGKLKGSDYFTEQLSLAERSLKKTRDQELKDIIKDHDAIEKERQLLMNRVNISDTVDKQRKEIDDFDATFMRETSNSCLPEFNLNKQGKDFLKLEQRGKDNISLNPQTKLAPKIDPAYSKIHHRMSQDFNYERPLREYK